MVEVNGALLTAHYAASHPGRDGGLAFAPPQMVVPTTGFDQRDGTFELDISPGTPPPGTATLSAVKHEPLGSIWFGRVHVRPRVIDFGNILTTVTARFELHNANDAPVTIASVALDPLLGVTLPDTVFPITLDRHVSTLDSAASTRLAPVGARAVAGATGLPSFRATALFAAPGGPVSLLLIGTRTVVLLFPWESGVREVLQFLTAVEVSASGKEQRVSVRSWPRQVFRGIRWRLTDSERQRLALLVEQLHGQALGLAVWTEQTRLTTTVTAGTLVLPVEDISSVDVRVGELALIYSSAQKFDVLRITAKTSTSITLETGTINSYAAGDFVMPMRLGRLPSTVGGSRFPVRVQDFVSDFTVDDNHTGAPAASTAGWPTLDGKVLVEHDVMVGGTSPESRERRLRVVDGDLGIAYVSSRESRDRRVHQQTWTTKTRAELMKLRKLMLAFRGRQVSFKVPTRIEDLTVTQQMTSGASTVVVTNVYFSRYVGSGRKLRFTFTDGTSLVRTAIASAELSAAEEQITLDASWPSTRQASEVARVEFIETARLDTDEVEIQHGQFLGQAAVSAPVRQVNA